MNFMRSRPAKRRAFAAGLLAGSVLVGVGSLALADGNSTVTIRPAATEAPSPTDVPVAPQPQAFASEAVNSLDRPAPKPTTIIAQSAKASEVAAAPIAADVAPMAIVGQSIETGLPECLPEYHAGYIIDCDADMDQLPSAVRDVAERLNDSDVVVSQGFGFQCRHLFADLRPDQPMTDYTEARVRCSDATRIETFANGEDQDAYEAARRAAHCRIIGSEDMYVRGDGWIVSPPRANMSPGVAQALGVGFVSYTCSASVPG